MTRPPPPGPLQALFARRRHRRAFYVQRWLCPGCGKVDAGNDSVCWNCGYSLARPETPPKRRFGETPGISRTTYVFSLVGLTCATVTAGQFASTPVFEWVASFSFVLTWVAFVSRIRNTEIKGHKRSKPIVYAPTADLPPAIPSFVKFQIVFGISMAIFPILMVAYLFIPPGCSTFWSSVLPAPESE